MKTFVEFLEIAAPPSNNMPPPGISGPGTLPPGPPMGGMPPAPMGGGLGMPMGGGGMPQNPAAQTAPHKLKAYNVWDVLEKILGKE